MKGKKKPDIFLATYLKLGIFLEISKNMLEYYFNFKKSLNL
jgi:hypothetical protein